MTKYVQHENIAARSVAGENLLIPIRGCTDRVFTLNGTGRGLWEMLATPCGEAELAAAIVTRFSVSSQTAREDVQRFLGTMVQKGLVDAVEDGRPDNAGP
jgi:hypothetical protein